MNSQNTQTEKRPSSHPNERATGLETGQSPTDLKHSSKDALRAWLLEAFSSVVAVAALAAIIVVLVVYNNRPLPDWPHNITLNTVVSVLQQVLNTGLGIILGESIAQAKWIWFSQKPRKLTEFDGIDSASTGPWGSFLLLLNPKLLLSPAAAGAVLMILALAVGPFTQQLISTPDRQISVNIAKLPQSTGYDATSAGGIQATKTVDLTMKAAIYNGIYNTDPSLFAVSVDCATGNCTWPIFSSLGVCSDCVNRTDLITKDCPESDDCTFSLPQGPTTITQGLSLNTFINATIASNMSGLPVFDSTITQFQVMVNPDGGIGDTPPVAFGCSLYYCIKTYQTSVQLGGLTEDILFTYPNSTTSPQTPNINNPVVLSQDGQNYTVQVSTAIAMSDYMSNLLSGSATGGIDEQDFSSDPIQAMYAAVTTNGSSIITFMQNLATSMTNTMRTDTRSSGSTFLSGVSLKTETYLAVKWGWISLPAAVVALHILLLIYIIWRTQREPVEAFKSSSLATVFAGLTEQRRGEIPGQVGTMEEIEKAARQLHVSLQKEDGEYRLA